MEALTFSIRWRAMMKTTAVAVVAACGLVLVGCSSSGKIDQMKFDGVYRSGKAMEGATGVGVNLLRYRELVQSFASEVSIANDRAQTSTEREMVAQYAKALKAYRDAETLWTMKLKGPAEVTIGSDSDLRRIVFDDDYRIDGSGAGSGFRFKLEEAVQALWSTARGRLNEATRLYTGQATRDLPEPR
jgi:hypothetical protein